MSEMGAEQAQRFEVGLGAGLDAPDIEPGEHGPAGPAGSTLDHAGAIHGGLDSAPGLPGAALDTPASGLHDAAALHEAGRKVDAGPEAGVGPEIGAGLPEPGESGPAEPGPGLEAGYPPMGDTGLGRSAVESPAGMMSDISRGLPGAEIAEPGEAGPAEAGDASMAGDAAAALHGVEAAAKDLLEAGTHTAQPGRDMDPGQSGAEALAQDQRTENR